MKKIFIFILLSFIIATSFAQAITLQKCYTAARKNYPAVKKLDYIKLNTKYLNINANRAYFPQLNVNGQATYQSEVTKIPQFSPNITIPTMSKDQYRIQAELIQTIFDGGFRTSQINMIKSQDAIQSQQVEITLNAVQKQVTDLYFAILMFDAQLRQQVILKTNLNNTLDKATTALANGTSFKSAVNEIKAELINANMTETEISSSRKITIDMLSQLTGIVFYNTTIFEEPAPPVELPSEIKRPELKLLDLQKDNLVIQKKQAASELLPTISAFAMGGYGRPTLNMLNNDFGSYWMGGIKLKWSINTLMSLPNTVKSLKMNDKMLDVDKEIFSLNTKMAMDKESGEIIKYKQLMQQDDEVIQLRQAVMESAKSQLKNGIITTTDYIVKLNAEYISKEIREVHRLQLLKAQYNYLNISGN